MSLLLSALLSQGFFLPEPPESAVGNADTVVVATILDEPAVSAINGNPPTLSH